jgi:hypothetical protein
MPDFSAFLKRMSIPGFNADPDFIISRDAIQVRLRRDGQMLPAQTVRFVPLQAGGVVPEVRGQAENITGLNYFALIGDSSFDVQRGDRLRFPDAAGGEFYDVAFVDRSMPGKVEARCKGMQ